jgi:hypothetical protein
MHIGARLILAAVFLVASEQARADDEEDLSVTQNQVLGNTITAKAPDAQQKAEPPQPIHPLKKSERKKLKKEGRRVISGEQWNAVTPENRDDLIRNLRLANLPGTIFVVDVRRGDVYKFDPLPPTEDRNAKDDERLKEEYKVDLRFFTPTDLSNLHAAVATDEDTHDDISGTNREFASGSVKGPP